jgi:hypothetical protein
MQKMSLGAKVGIPTRLRFQHNTDSVRLEPGAAKSFWKKDWDFLKNPIRDCCTHLDAPQYYVRVVSTRGAIYYAAAIRSPAPTRQKRPPTVVAFSAYGVSPYFL